MTCKNCGNEFEGKFCNYCGQKNFEKRFTIKDILHDFFHSFTHVDSGIIFLFKELFFRPGIVAKEYIEGKRKKYFSPLQYLVITVAVSTFLAVNFNLFGSRVDPSTIAGLNDLQMFFLKFQQFIYKYYNLILFVSVPIGAFYSYLFFKKSGYNYAENLVFNSFIAGQRNIIYILLTPFLYFFMNKWFIIIGLYFLLWLVYFGFAFVQFFGGKKSHTILKFICVAILLWITNQIISIGVFYLFFFR